jgi:hypothetical protein
MVQFAKTVIDVVPLDQTSKSMRYLATAEQLDPVVKIRLNDVFRMHTLVTLQFKDVCIGSSSFPFAHFVFTLRSFCFFCFYCPFALSFKLNVIRNS